MGVTQRLGTIPLAIFTDASNNIGIGGSPSGSYKFEVTGSGNYSTSLYAKQSYLNTTSAGYNNPSLLINSQSGVSVVLQAIADSSGRLIRFYNSDFNNSNTGTDVRMGFADGSGNTSFNMQVYTAGETAAGNLILQPSYGYVGIGTSTPASRLFVSTTAGATKAYDDLSKTNIMVFDNTSMAAGVGGSITFGGYKTAQTAGGNFAAIDGVKENGTAGNEAGAFRIWTANSTGVFGERMRIRSDGIILSLPTYNNTTGNAANVQIGTAGEFQRSTASSQRFKENIIDWDGNGLDTILSLKPKTFTYKEDYYSCPDRQFLGLIAEEVAEVSSFLADFENEDGTGQVENVRYANIVVPLIKAIQELSAKVSALENKS
jgi:hypothetical protein